MNEKIMLVDDEKGLVTMMKNYFEMSGYQVISDYVYIFINVRTLSIYA